VALAVGAARPQRTSAVPSNRTSIVLALDVSLSMCAVDVAPNRLTVAQDAVRAFIEGQDDGTRIGIVSFASAARLVVAPTTDEEELISAVDGFTASIGTTIGNAILESVDAIAELNPDVAPARADLSGDVDREALADSDDFVADIVVLLTDGANVQGVDPIEAAIQASDRRVRVYTIGFGTDDPEELVCAPDQLGAGSFEEIGGFLSGGDDGFGGFRQFLVIDEPTLQDVADITGGEYFRATDAEQLTEVFRDLPSQVTLQDEEHEISAWFVATAALLIALALGLSLRWNRYP
jgi:Ca-activated chloride channel family protein